MEPVVLIAQGSWHTPTHYADLVSHIQDSGLPRVVCPHLPSTRFTRTPLPPDISYHQDAIYLCKEITKLADAGHPILLMMHSSGSIVGHNALDGLLWPQRQAAGQPGGVVHLFYFSAFLFRKGVAIATPFGGALPPWLDDDPAEKTMTIKNERMAFFSHLSEDKAEYWRKTLTLCASSVTRDEITWEPYEYVGKGVDATYLVLTGDYGTSGKRQEEMAELLGPTGRMEELDSGHCAMLGDADRMAPIVKRAWEISRKRLEQETGS